MKLLTSFKSSLSRIFGSSLNESQLETIAKAETEQELDEVLLSLPAIEKANVTSIDHSAELSSLNTVIDQQKATIEDQASELTSLANEIASLKDIIGGINANIIELQNQTKANTENIQQNATAILNRKTEHKDTNQELNTLGFIEPTQTKHKGFVQIPISVKAGTLPQHQ